MRLVTISDLHINTHDDIGLNYFKHFCQHPLVRESTHVAFLGDIFDLMVGDHRAYDQRWQVVWDQINKFCDEGKIVYFAEGNHDMHLKQFVSRKAIEFQNSNRFIHIDNYLVIEILEKRVLLSHGDELNKEDTPYLKYKKFIKTPFWSFVANNLMPLTVLDFLGVKASKQSRKYGSRKFDEQEVRSKFRAGLKDYSDLSLHVYIGGHSHVSDTFQIDNLLYLNNGYPPKSNVFVVMDSSGARLEPLLM